MQPVFDAPVTAHRVGKTGRTGADATDEIPGFNRDLAVDLAVRFDHADHVHRLPQFAARYAGEITQGAVATGLKTAMSTLDGLQELRVDTVILPGIGIDERLLDLAGQRFLVALERQHVIAALQ